MKYYLSRYFKGERRGILFVLPAIVILIIVLGFPILFAITLSFLKIESINLDFSFVGFKNFQYVLNDKKFWNALLNTMTYTFSSVILQFLLGFILALIFDAKWLRGRSILRVIFMIPWTLSYVVISVTWRWVLNAQYGILNAFLRNINLITENISFLGSSDLAMPTVILVNVWRGFPFMMVMLYAGLQLIPLELIEAAKVDGASSIQTFFFIKLPHLKKIITISTVLAFIRVFIQFDLTQTLTAGGPAGNTELFSNLIYKYSFQFYQFGYGAALSTLMLIIVIFFSYIYVRLLQEEN